MTLSKESQAFLDNMRVYLVTSNKKEDDVNELIEELEDHLHEAELNGKSVEHIIGKSPKAYMKEIEVEVETDKKFWFGIVPLILLNAFAYLIMNKAIDDDRNYSLLQLIGSPILFALSMLLIFGSIRFMVSNKLSKKKEVMMYIAIGLISSIMFAAVFLADLFIETPVLIISPSMNIIVILVACSVFVASAIYWKAWISVIVPAVLYIPQLVLRYIDINEESKLIIILSIFMVLSLSLWIWYFIQSKKND